MVSKTLGKKYRRKNTPRPDVHQPANWEDVPDACTHCRGTGDCPGCEGDTTDGCGQCRPFRAGSCRACDGQGDHS